jgi:glycosyltransferase involved in cell wall biosynthesis
MGRSLPSCSVIVTTYNDPGKLALVLEGLALQTSPPDEIVVADDGSTVETEQLVEAWRSRMPAPLAHVWQADHGFRKMRACNLAVLHSRGDRLLFLDGDSIPHSRWVEDHRIDAHRADVLCGRRVKLGPAASAGVDAACVRAQCLERVSGAMLWSGLRGETQRLALGIRLPAPLARLLHPRPRKLMGVNFSVSRRAFEAINGYSHDAPAKREDRDLEIRLLRSGARFAALLNRAIVYHLHHRHAPASAGDEHRMAELERGGDIACRNGLRQLADSGEPTDKPVAGAH